MEKIKKKKVSIIIPSWLAKNHDGRYGKNEVYYIASKCIERMLEVTDRSMYELIIIDNGSNLETSDISSELFPVEWYWKQADILIRNKSNLGFGPAVNQGIALASGEYILQLNNDILMWSGWLEEILKVFDQDLEPKVGMSMPALEKSGKRFPEILECKKEDIDMKTNAGKWGERAQFGSCWCMKKSLLDKLYKQDGFYFDPQFEFLFKEDRDLYERVYALGYGTWRTHNTRVHHVGNLTVSKFPNRKEISAKNRERFATKWPDVKKKPVIVT